MKRELPSKADTERVLLVEDEPRLREMLLRALAEMGFDPTAAASAEAAMRRMEKHSYGILIVDLNLPGIGGIELLSHVRHSHPGVQAIILTGFGDLSAARQAIHLDVVDFLTKPCALGDLEIALDRARTRLLKQPGPPRLGPETAPEDEDTESQSPARRYPGIEDDPDEKLDGEPAPQRLRQQQFAPRESSASVSLEDVERQTIMTVLARHNGNRTAAAAELGISLRKLYYRLAQYHKQCPPT